MGRTSADVKHNIASKPKFLTPLFVCRSCRCSLFPSLSFSSDEVVVVNWRLLRPTYVCYGINRHVIFGSNQSTIKCWGHQRWWMQGVMCCACDGTTKVLSQMMISLKNIQLEYKKFYTADCTDDANQWQWWPRDKRALVDDSYYAYSHCC